MNCVRAGTETFAALWSSLWRQDERQNPFYSPLNLQYQTEYHDGSVFEDCSLVVVENDRPVLGVLMAVRTFPGGRRELSGYGRPILYLEDTEFPEAQRQRAFRQVKETLNVLRGSDPAPRVLYQEAGAALSPLGQFLLECGAKPMPYFTQVIDLRLTGAELHQRVRKSYKSQINWGCQNLNLRLLDNASIQADDRERFRRLHCHAAGRVTRSAATWQRQLEMVQAGEAFVVEGSWQGEVVTAALFQHSPCYCLYGVSASKRELFDKPLAHAVIWTGILHAQQLGCLCFEMGGQVYPGLEDPPPTEKEMSIATFKRGFGGRTEIRLTLSWEAP